MKEPVDHIVRPRLPWRPQNEPTVTECGYDASKVKTLSRDAFLARLKEYGQRRTAILTCMTCMQTATRWPTWENDPRKALEREITWESAWREKRGDRLKDELIAIATLIGLHSAEFASLVEDARSRREWIERKRKPDEPEPSGFTWHQV